MPSSIEQYDRIERYLDGVMPPGELKAFTQELATDPDLASAVALHRELAETLAGDQIHQFRQTLKEVDAKWKPRSGGNWLRIVRSPRMLSFAASLLLLIGIFTWLIWPNPTFSELAVDNFEQLPLETQMSIDRNDIDEIRKQAHEAYFAEDYDLATDKFLALSERVPDDLSYQLYLGISQFGADEVETAITTLKPLAESNDQSLKGEATWYLALAYLKMDNGSAAGKYLEQLVQTKGYKWERATEIINAMD